MEKIRGCCPSLFHADHDAAFLQHRHGNCGRFHLLSNHYDLKGPRQRSSPNSICIVFCFPCLLCVLKRIERKEGAREKGYPVLLLFVIFTVSNQNLGLLFSAPALMRFLLPVLQQKPAFLLLYVIGEQRYAIKKFFLMQISSLLDPCKKQCRNYSLPLGILLSF